MTMLSLTAQIEELNNRKKQYGETNMLVLDQIAAIGLHHFHVSGHDEEALHHFREALRIVEDLISYHMRTLHTADGDNKRWSCCQYYVQKGVLLTDIGNVHARNEAYEDALFHYESALRVFRSMGMKEDHPRVISTNRCLDRLQIHVHNPVG